MHEQSHTQGWFQFPELTLRASAEAEAAGGWGTMTMSSEGISDKLGCVGTSPFSGKYTWAIPAVETRVKKAVDARIQIRFITVVLVDHEGFGAREHLFLRKEWTVVTSVRRNFP